MIRRPPRATRTDTLFPYTTLFRSMMSTNNILSPANGKPIIVPSQDMVLGLYYLSLEREGEPGEGMLLADMAEVHQALHVGAVTLHTKVVSRVPQTDEQGKDYLKRFETTPGRMLIGECLPKSHTVPFDVVNRLLTKKEKIGRAHV